MYIFIYVPKAELHRQYHQWFDGEKMSGIFDRLGYNFDDPDNKVVEYDDGVTKHLQSLPSLLADWQFKDIADANTAGYYTNSVANTTNEIISLCSSIVIDANGVSELTAIGITSNTIAQVRGPYFLAHTNRLTGVTPFTPQNIDKPHLDIALGRGSIISYLTYQSDGVGNTAASLGSFTSLLIKDTLVERKDQLAIYQQQISDSIVTTIIPGLPPIITKSTTLTPGQISTIQTFITNLSNLLYTRYTHDENYYTNMSGVIDDYQKVKNFSNMGQSKSYLINDFVGSNKLKNRLNQT